jgi:hypothetical protein
LTPNITTTEKSPIVERRSPDSLAQVPVFATLGGRPLVPNRGIPLNLDWVEDVQVNTSAVERRAQTLVTRRTGMAAARHHLHGSHHALR